MLPIFAMKKKQQEQLAVLAMILIPVGIWLASNSDCEHGCQTFAGHLIDYGLADLFKGLFAIS